MKPEELRIAPTNIELGDLTVESQKWLSSQSQDILRRLIYSFDQRALAFDGFLNLIRQSDHEIEQILAKALHYPTLGERTVDGVKETCDPSAPGAIDTGVYCVGDHVPVTLAMEAAREIENLRNGP